ncbi:CopG family transcriptional regulator [Sphingobium terrigena]|uniref:CopG family transcriptional regulator n=1 Tax=Sphingobium terrigena TaxID=2304063 RepID=A0A418YLR9_9SPHN|nr:CopG family transcriptional regulator [Sphingobium terrigena]RJG52033.1 CopG family transcriptional regulator [Sphingobium terrigena]
MTDDEAFAHNYAEREQAKALREQARAGGLRFEAYLPPDMADWLLERVERGMFVDPSEAVFAIVKNFIELEPHRDLRDELLRRMLQAAIDDPRPRIPHEEVCSRMERWLAEPRAEAARWEKIAP